MKTPPKNDTLPPVHENEREGSSQNVNINEKKENNKDAQHAPEVQEKTEKVEKPSHRGNVFVGRRISGSIKDDKEERNGGEQPERPLTISEFSFQRPSFYTSSSGFKRTN